MTTYLKDNYARLGCLTRPVDEPQARNAVALLRQARVVIDDLTVLDHGVRTLVVADSLYTLTAGNLRSALHDPPVLSLDTIRAIDPTVYGYCIAHPAAYLTACRSVSLPPRCDALVVSHCHRLDRVGCGFKLGRRGRVGRRPGRCRPGWSTGRGSGARRSGPARRAP